MLFCMFVGAAWAQGPATNKAYTLTTANRGGLAAHNDATQCVGYENIGVNEEAQKNFAFVQYEGNVYLYNVWAKKFMMKDGKLSTSLPIDAITYEIQDDGKYFFKFDDTHIINLGGSKQLAINDWGSSYWGTKDEGNLFTINEVEEFDPAEALSFLNNSYNITYNVIFDGKTVYTETTKITKGENYPAIAGLPWGVVVTIPDGAPTEDETVELTATIDSSVYPFDFAADYESITTWYYLKFNTDKNCYLHHDAGQDHIDLGSKAVDPNNKDIYTWAFVGNPFDGYKIVNKGAGEGYILSSSTTMAGDTGAGTWPIMTAEASLPSGNNTYWIPSASSHATKGFFLAQKGFPANRLNDRGKLAYWTSGAGTGSTFVATERQSELVEVAALVAEYNAWVAEHVIGTGLGEYSLNTEVLTAAMAQLDAATTTAAASAAITTCKSAFSLNMPTAGFYRIKSMNGNDPDKKGKYIETDGGNLALTAEATVNGIMYLDGSNNLVSYALGVYQNTYKAPEAKGATGSAWAFIENAQVIGTYTIDNPADTQGGTQYFMSDWTGGVTYGQNDANAAWMLEEVTSLPVAISAAGYATLYAPVALTLPAEGLKAYTVTVNGESAKLKEIEGGVIPAETGVVLGGTEGTYNLTVAGSADAIADNELLGTVAASYVTEDAYVLGYVGEEGSEEVGFYTATKNQQEGASWLNNGFKAYLPKTGLAATLRFNFGGTTAIESVLNNGIDANAAIYDLSGRRVEKAVKGIYIQNGKKIIVK